METVNFLTLLLLLGLTGWVLIAAARSKQGLAALGSAEDERPLPRPCALALWALILALCALRLWRFGAVPGGFNQDGAMAAVDALALSRYGTDRFGTRLPAHFTAWGYGQMSVLLSYCMVPLIRLFGLSAVTARLPMLLASFLGMAAAWALLRVLASRRAAWIGLLLIAIAPWHFMQSRWALDCNLFPHCFLCGLALLAGAKGRPAALYGSMVCFALCMYSYGVAFTMVPLFLLGAVILLLRGRAVRPGQALLCAAIYFLIAFPIYGTMLINAMGWKTVALPFVTMPFFPHSVRAGDLVFFSEQPAAQLLANARSLWRVAFLQERDLLWNAIDGFGAIYRCSMPPAALGLGLSVYRAFRGETAEKRLAYRLLLLYWLCSVVTGLCVNNVNINRINIIFYAHLLFLALGLHALIRFERKSAIALLGCYALLGTLFFCQYFGPWAQRISDAFFEDFLRAVTYAGEQDCDRYYITPDVQYSGSRQVSEILTMYALQIDAAYFQGDTPEGEQPYRERYRYENADPALLPESGSAACVLKAAAAPPQLPPGWVRVDFDSYCVLIRNGG